MWDKILQYLNDNKDALGWLFGSGIIVAVLGGIYRFINWLFKEYRLRKIRTNDNFPFKIIPPNSNVAKEILGGSDDDPLADRNIPYQQRIQGRNIRRELEELIEGNRWILITGRTGLGKTREAVQLAQSLNNEGWTILYLTHDAWLDAPAKLPSNVPERKVLFFLDDLNKKCHSSKAEIRPDIGESLTLPMNEPFQTRLQRTLEAFDTFCGKSEIRAIATARNEKTSEFDEPSEWEKLGWAKYNGLWGNFKLLDLPEPDKKSEQQLLVDTAEKANIHVSSDDISTLAIRNDGTFRNLVENLASAKTEGSILSAENFRDTLKGTWKKRYQRALLKHPEAKHIYDAIELLRYAGIDLRFSYVREVAIIIAEITFYKRIYYGRKFFFILNQLIETENLLQPRDGQIEAKGYRLYIDEYLPKLYRQVYSNYFETYPSAFIRVFSRLIKLLYLNLAPKSAFNPIKKMGRNEKIIFSALVFDVPYSFIGRAYSRLGFTHISQQFYRKSLEIDSANRINRIIFKRSTAGYWNSLGCTHHELGQFDDAISAFKKANEFSPNNASLWGNMGIVYQFNNKIDDAITAYKKSIEINPKYVYSILSLALCYKVSGNNLESEELLKSIEKSIESEEEYFQACFQIANGNVDQALLLLKSGLIKEQTSKMWAQKDPNFESIRDNPHFKEIVGLE